MGLKISEKDTSIERSKRKIWCIFIELTTKFSLPFIPEKDLKMKVSEYLENFDAEISVTYLKCKKPRGSYLFYATVKNGEKEVATVHHLIKPSNTPPHYASL